jgi:RNA polymerase sigma factor (sigma-70 family)
LTKQQLQEYRRAAAEIERLKERIGTVKNELYGMRSVLISDMPRGTPERDRLERLCDLKSDLITEYEEQVNEQNIHMLEIENAIRALTDERYRTVLSMRYLDGRSWGYIAEHMGYDLRWVYRLHGRALKKIK